MVGALEIEDDEVSHYHHDFTPIRVSVTLQIPFHSDLDQLKTSKWRCWTNVHVCISCFGASRAEYSTSSITRNKNFFTLPGSVGESFSKCHPRLAKQVSSSDSCDQYLSYIGRLITAMTSGLRPLISECVHNSSCTAASVKYSSPSEWCLPQRFGA